MDQLEFLIQEITNRILDKLDNKKNSLSVYWIGEKNVSDYFLVNCTSVDQIEQAQHIVASGLEIDALLRIANLCPMQPEEIELVQVLLKGKTVLVPETTFNINDYRKTSKNKLYQELVQAKRKLEGFGVQFFQKDELTSYLNEEQSVNVRQLEKKQPKKKVVLTEAKVKAMELEETGILNLEKGTIITALARDYLIRNGIKVVE